MPSMKIIIPLLMGLAAYLIFTGQANKQRSVSLRDEYLAHTHTTVGVNKTKNLIIGILIVTVAAYVVTGQMMFVVLASPAGFYVAQSLNSRYDKARQKALKMQEPALLSAIKIPLQGGGVSPIQAIEDSVAYLASPSKEIIQEIVNRVRTGMSYRSAFQSVYAETGWKVLRDIEGALESYEQSGANLTAVFNHLLNTAYNKQRINSTVEAGTSQSLAAAKFMSGIPFIVMIALRFMNPQLAAPLFTTVGGVGVILLVVGMLLMGNKLQQNMIKGVVGPYLE